MVPVNSRGKVIALSTAAVGLVVLVAAGIAAKDRMREEWYLWKLEKSGYRNVEHEAAIQLGELGSAKVVPILFKKVKQWGDLSFAEEPLARMRGRTFVEVLSFLKCQPDALNWHEGMQALLEPLTVPQLVEIVDSEILNPILRAEAARYLKR